MLGKKQVTHSDVAKETLAWLKSGNTRPRHTKYYGKVLVEIEENGKLVWQLSDGAELLRKELPKRKKKTFASHIKLIRKCLRQTQVGFAELIGVPVSTVRNWEQGRRIPHIAHRTLMEMASVNPEALIQTRETIEKAKVYSFPEG